MKRDLPPLPGFARAVTVPEPKRGEPLIVIAAREKAGRLAANGIIVELGDWYGGVRRDYAGETQ